MNLERPFLKGENIYMQPMDASYIDGHYLEWVNDDEIINNMSTLFFPTTEEGLLNYIKVNTNRNDRAFFAIRWRENNEFIGTAKLGPINWVHRSAHYGRLIGNKNYRGKGVGTDVAKLILSYGFRCLNLHWIGAGSVSENKAAIRSNEKAGLRIVATIPKKMWFKGRYVDHVFMGITAEEYFSSQEV
jgi:RimJ/RimL family protein N-acetyltransferase